MAYKILPDARIPGTDTCLPGTRSIKEMVKLANCGSDYAKDMVINALIRAWHLADNQSNRHEYRAPLREAILSLYPDWK